MTDLLHREKQKPRMGTTTCHHQMHKPTCICLHPSTSPYPIMTEEGTVLLKTASVKNLGFPYHLLSPSQRPLSLLYFDPSFSNIQTSTYVFHLKTQNLPQLHSCPTTALTLSLSFKTTFLKKLKFLSPHLLPSSLQLGSYPYHAIQRFYQSHQGP